MHVVIRTNTGWRGEYDDAELQIERESFVVTKDGKVLVRLPRESVVYWSAE